MSMRPSGRNAMRQGRLNVATWVIVNGRVASGVCVPALNCACAAVETKVRSSVARTNIFIVFPSPYFFVMTNTTQSTPHGAIADSRITIHMVASLDGFIARKEGRVDWLETSDEFSDR